MASDETIRAALRAAAEAMRRSLRDQDGAGGVSPHADGYIDITSVDDEQTAAAAVAEFLKQMDSVPLGDGFTFAALAAALARAAEGEG